MPLKMDKNRRRHEVSTKTAFPLGHEPADAENGWVILEAMLFGVMAEGTVGDLEEF